MLPSVRRFTAVSLLGLLALPLSACGEDSTGPDDALFTVRGPLINRTDQPVPDGAHVAVAWTVSSGSPDYTYVFGEGTVDGDGYRVRFDAPPPAEALNAGSLGVGLILLTDAPIQPGSSVDDLDPSRILGVAGEYAVIYKAPGAGAVRGWIEDFPDGYSVGRGVEREGDFDAFAPVDPGTVELIVDDLENIELVNWT